MKRVVMALALIVIGATGSLGVANAGMPNVTLGFALRALSGIQGIPAPPEWDGIWATVDSTYFPCELPFGNTATRADTICTGQAIGEPSDSQFNVSCTGNADATTFHLECTGTADLGNGCTGTVDFTVDGTRTGDHYKRITVMNFTPDTPSEECIAICIRTVSYGSRTGPAPTAYCSITKVNTCTWGRIKLLYR